MIDILHAIGGFMAFIILTVAAVAILCWGVPLCSVDMLKGFWL